jgi:hypothetical protein
MGEVAHGIKLEISSMQGRQDLGAGMCMLVDWAIVLCTCDVPHDGCQVKYYQDDVMMLHGDICHMQSSTQPTHLLLHATMFCST